MVRVVQSNDGRIQLYKALHKTKIKKPYPKMERASLPVYAHHSKADDPQYVRIGSDRYTPGGGNFSGRDSDLSIANLGDDVNAS